MKNKFKILITAALFILMISLSAAVCHASGDVPEDTVYAEEASDTGDAYDAETAVSDDTADNVFSIAFEKISIYSAEILCALTFIGSLILSYAYKKGLLPLIRGALSGIGAAVAKIEERTQKSEECTSGIENALTERFNTLETVFGMIGERIELLEKSLDSIKESDAARAYDKENLSLIVATQIDMLNDIFMTSALPQYQKDAVGERVRMMKEALAQNEAK